MIGKRRMALIAVAVASAAFLGSCEMVMSLFNKPPKVSLAITDNYDASLGYVVNDQEIEITATVSDPDKDTVTVAWFVGGTDQDYNKLVGYFSPTGKTSDTTVTVKVVATDEHGEQASATLDIKVKATATFQIENASGTAMTQFKAKASGASTYGSDWFGGDNLPNDYYATFIGMPAGTYDFTWLYGSNSGNYTGLSLSSGIPKGLRATGSTASTYTPESGTYSILPHRSMAACMVELP